MKGALIALFFFVAIASALAASTPTQTSPSCSCPNLLTGVADLITQLQTILLPILTPLGGLGNLVKQLLELVKNVVNQLGNGLTNGGLLGFVGELVDNILDEPCEPL